MIGKLHVINGKKTFACCDKELLGQNLNFNDFDVSLSTGFFGNSLISLNQIIIYLDDCDSANLFGKKICGFLIKKNLIIENQIIMIGDIPHVQIYKL